MSTPKGRLYSSKKEKPDNPFHLKEYTSSEFSELMDTVFSKMNFYGQLDYTLKNCLLELFGKYFSASKILYANLIRTSY
jgi:hypothetical protein